MRKYLNLKNLISCFFLYGLISLTQAQNSPIPIDKRIKIGKLPNGMAYYICKNAKPEKRVELRLAVNAGAVQENESQLGMAHFAEHMCFNGTVHFPKNDLIHYLQSVGVGFGDGINGYTSFDQTVYMLTVPSDSEKILNNGILIMEDWANGVTFDTGEISKERGVILEEWRLRLGANKRMENKYIPVLLKGSKYANHLPIGTKESILQTPPDSIKRFYNDWYRPDLMAFIVVGDIDPDKMEQKILAEFSLLKEPSVVRKKGIYKVDDNIDPLVCVVSDKENTRTNIRVAYKTESKPIRSLDDYKYVIRRNIFCSILNQRLSELTQSPNPPFLYASAYYGNLWVRTLEAFQVNVGVKEDGVERGLKTALIEIERVKRFGFTQPELIRMKKNFIKGAENSYNERDKQESGNLVWDCVYHFLDNDPIPGIEFYYNFIKNYIDSIHLEDINKLANEWITDKNQVAIVTGVEKEGVSLPSEETIKSELAWAKSQNIEPYKETQVASSLMNKKPVPGKVVSQKLVSGTGITELMLSNGVRVVLKPTDFKNDEINMQSYSEGGNSLFGNEYKLSAQFATSIISQSGLDKFSNMEIRKILAGKNAGAQPYISNYYSGIDGNSSASDIETMFQLAYLTFTAPRCIDSIYTSVVSRIAAQYKNELSNPQSYFYNQVRLIKYNNNPDAPGVFPNDKDWQNLTPAKVMEVYKRCFSNAANFTFFLVGSFKNEQIIPLIETYLGSLPSTGKKETYVDKGLRPIEGPLNKDILRGEDPKSIVYLCIDDKSKIWSKKESHLVYSLCNILRNIYTDKLREEMSGVYGFGIGGDVESIPYNNFSFYMTIPCAPENTDKLTNAVYAEIERIKKQGPTAAELEKEVAKQKRELEVNQKENWWWMFVIDRSYRLEKDFNRVEKPYELVDLLTIENMKETANKYLESSKMVRFNWYPEKLGKDTGTK
jgi:zinc protease